MVNSSEVTGREISAPTKKSCVFLKKMSTLFEFLRKILAPPRNPSTTSRYILYMLFFLLFSCLSLWCFPGCYRAFLLIQQCAGTSYIRLICSSSTVSLGARRDIRDSTPYDSSTWPSGAAGTANKYCGSFFGFVYLKDARKPPQTRVNKNKLRSPNTGHEQKNKR